MKSEASSYQAWKKPVAPSGSECQSAANTKSVLRGLTLTDVLIRAWKHPFTTKSDFAREAANLIGMGASDGFLTTRIATGMYGSRWQITPVGLKHLWRLIDYHGDDA